MPRLSQVRLSKRVVETAMPGQCISDSEVRGFRLIVSPKGARRFVAAYRVGAKGRSSMKALGIYPTLTVEQARERAREVLRLARARIDPHEVDSAAREAAEAARKAPTVRDLARVYLEDYAISQALRPATIRDARTLSAKALTAIGDMKVAAVGITDIRKLHGEVRATGVASGHKGVYQANRMLAVLSKMFSLSIERGWRSDNPCKGVRKFPEDQRWRNLSEREVGALLRACDDYEAGVRPVGADDDPKLVAQKRTPLPMPLRSVADREASDAIRLLLFTGARLQEVLKSQWGQFDLEAGLWEKPSAHTKTKRQHRLELDGPALELLREMSQRKSDPVYLFPGKTQKHRRTAPVEIHSGQRLGIGSRADLKRPWSVIASMAGLSGVRLHDLRRTTASFMLSGGASLATVGKALGHTQPSTTARYATLSSTVQREGLKLAGERMAAAKAHARPG